MISLVIQPPHNRISLNLGRAKRVWTENFEVCQKSIGRTLYSVGVVLEFYPWEEELKCVDNIIRVFRYVRVGEVYATVN